VPGAGVAQARTLFECAGYARHGSIRAAPLLRLLFQRRKMETGVLLPRPLGTLISNADLNARSYFVLDRVGAQVKLTRFLAEAARGTCFVKSRLTEPESPHSKPRVSDSLTKSETN
jgi:hypothetical protein